MATATILLAVAATSCAHAFQPSLLPLTSTRISSSSPFPSSSSSAGYRSIPSRARAWRCSARDDGRRTVEETRVNRREAAVVLSSIVLLPTLTSAAAQDDVKLPLAPPGGPRNIVITGSSSGIGKDAACKLAAGGYNVFLACRTMEKAMEARDSVEEEVKLLASKAGRSPGELTAMECDLSSLSSIKKFADEWNKSGKPIDVLVLNAGVALNTGARPPPPRTKDGFEVTVGTNHLGHFYLTNLLLPAVEKSSAAPRIVVTASQVHDPSSPGGNVGSKATLGDMQGLAAGIDWEMVDGGGWDADKAYKDSKLCNVLFTRELQRRLEDKGSKVTCNCFSPGLITRTGLFRDQGGFFLSAFDFIANNVVRVAETVSFGGDCLVTMAVSDALEGKRGVFWSNSKPGKHTFEEVEVSAEAKDAQKARRLWELSEQAIALALKKQQA